jgi:alpha-tubulin suppressor-like RCC1 family protein
VHVSVGGQITCATDSSGKIYTWGFGGSKRLGHGSTNNELVPRVLQALASVFVSRVTCGHFHVAAVTSVGSVYTWGDGDFGKLGHGNVVFRRHHTIYPYVFTAGNVDSASVPTLCRLMRDAVADVACGRDHTLALTSAGGLFAWGCNKDGRLGLGHTQTVYEPNMYHTLFVV